MSRLLLLLTLLLGPVSVGCYRAGMALPVPLSASDSNRAAFIESAGAVYITTLDGEIVLLSGVSVAYPEILGRMGRHRIRLAVPIDSVELIQARDVHGLKTVGAVMLGGVLLVGSWLLSNPTIF